MMKRTMMQKLAVAASASALAFGAAACQVEDGEGLDPAQEEDPLLEGDAGTEGDTGLGGDAGAEGDAGAGG